MSKATIIELKTPEVERTDQLTELLPPLTLLFYRMGATTIPQGALRATPMGRHNWLFCWTEFGAKQVGIIQSVLVTCKLQGINPYTYLVDVLQRISQHTASQVIELAPRIWKENFADNPLLSDLERLRQ